MKKLAAGLFILILMASTAAWAFEPRGFLLKGDNIPPNSSSGVTCRLKVDDAYTLDLWQYDVQKPVISITPYEATPHSASSVTSELVYKLSNSDNAAVWDVAPQRMLWTGKEITGVTGYTVSFTPNLARYIRFELHSGVTEIVTFRAEGAVAEANGAPQHWAVVEEEVVNITSTAGGVSYMSSANTPFGRATVTFQGDDVRYRLTTDPTATAGIVAKENDYLVVDNIEDLVKMRMILETGGSAASAIVVYEALR